MAHTAFSAEVSTQLVDLRQAPFSAEAAKWLHLTDHSATQAFARAARTANVGGIQYKSVRDPQSAWCVTLLTPQAFARPKPNPLGANLVARRPFGCCQLAARQRVDDLCRRRMVMSPTNSLLI